MRLAKSWLASKFFEPLICYEAVSQIIRLTIICAHFWLSPSAASATAAALSSRAAAASRCTRSASATASARCRSPVSIQQPHWATTQRSPHHMHRSWQGLFGDPRRRRCRRSCRLCNREHRHRLYRLCPAHTLCRTCHSFHSTFSDLRRFHCTRFHPTCNQEHTFPVHTSDRWGSSPDRMG